MRTEALGCARSPLPAARRPVVLATVAGFLLCVAALLAAGPLTAAARAEPSWPTYHRDAIRTGVDPDATEPLDQPVLAWQSADLKAPMWNQPLILGNRVYVATIGNDLYALDAATGKQVWKQHLGTPVPASQLLCGDVVPTVGVVGTPVIDPPAGRIFAVADTWDATSKEASHVLKGYTLEGKPVVSQPVDPPGTEPKDMLQRTALNLDQGRVIFGFGGNRGDCGDYQGTIVSASETTGSPIFWRYAPAPPSTSGGAVWGPSGPAVDAAGHVIASTGNPDPPEGTKAETYDYSSSVIELDQEMNVVGWFQPPTWLSEVNTDTDLGSAGPEVLPGGVIFQAGKSGTGYLLDASTMGEAAPAVYSHQICSGHGSFGGDAYSEGVIYVPCTNGVAALAYDQVNRTFTQIWQGPSDSFGPPIVSGGLVWTEATGGFVGGGKKLYALNPKTGTPVHTLTLPSPIIDHFGSPSAAGGRLFVATGSTVTAYQIAQLSAPPPPPEAVTQAASSIGPQGALLNGSVDPKGSAVTDCHFDYGKTTAYGTSVPCEPLPGAGSGPEPVTAALEGLAPSTTYHYRLVATGAGGTGEGADKSLKTLAPPAPSAVSGEADEIDDTSATLNATVNPNGFAVSDCHFEYGPTAAYGSSAPCSPEPGSGDADVAVSAALTGLEAGTTYHFRIVAKGAGGQGSGGDRTFKTLAGPPPPSPPTVVGGAPTAVTETSATLHASVNPNGSTVSECRFDYGTTEAYGASVACSSLPGGGSSPVAVSAALEALTADTTYHFRIVAKNAADTSFGSDQTLKTVAAPPPPVAPTVTTEAASAIGEHTATLHASVNPNGSTVSQCRFDYGTTEAYGASVACSSLPGGGSSAAAVSASPAGLAAGSTYHFRIVAKNAGGTSLGTDESLTTHSTPPPPPLPPSVVTGIPFGITQSSALLRATVNPNSSAVTACHFEYGTTKAYGTVVGCAALPGSGSSPVAVSGSASGLAASTTYHFRSVATGPGGTTAGGDTTFTTTASLFTSPPAPGPASPAATAAASVLPSTAVKHAPPVATIAAGLTRVNRAGGLVLAIRCASACIGRVTLRTTGPVLLPAAAAAAAPRRRVLTLATAAFKIAGGETRRVALHLGPRARALLARSHSLRARLTILAHDDAGVRRSHATVVLRLARGAH